MPLFVTPPNTDPEPEPTPEPVPEPQPTPVTGWRIHITAEAEVIPANTESV